MKKYMLAGSFVVGLFSLSHAALDSAGSPRPPVWRSSHTESADSYLSIASGTIFFHGVVPSSPVAGGNITIYSGDPQPLFVSSLTLVTRIDLNQNTPKNYDLILSSGLVYMTTGTLKADILWDWFGYNNKR